jgi:4a-hydroxytetrahydrobiopterin dehydratase
MSDLLQKTCKPCEGGVDALDIEAARALLAQLDEGWGLSDDATEIRREFRFSNYYETLAFVNATAWISHAEDHHPDLEVGYNRCLVRYSTHAIGGLSENDFICAAKVDALLT